MQWQGSALAPTTVLLAAAWTSQSQPLEAKIFLVVDGGTKQTLLRRLQRDCTYSRPLMKTLCT